MTSYPYGMKWYKFLIYFGLFASAVLNTFIAIMFFTGISFGKSTESIFKLRPDLRTIYILFGIAYCALTILALATRSALYRKKKAGPEMISTLLKCNAYGAIGFEVILLIGFRMPFSILSITSFAVWSIMDYVNSKYFKKRKSLFIN